MNLQSIPYLFILTFLVAPLLSKSQTIKIIQADYIFNQAPFQACQTSTLVELKKDKLWLRGLEANMKDIHLSYTDERKKIKYVELQIN